MSYYELIHGYFIYMNERNKEAFICKNENDIYKVADKKIKDIKFVKITTANYPVIDAILRGEDTDGIKKAIAEYRKTKPEYSDKSLEEIKDSLTYNDISKPLNRARERFRRLVIKEISEDNENAYSIAEKIAYEIFPKKDDYGMYYIPVTRRIDMPTMDDYKVQHDPDVEQNHELVLENTEPVQSFPETYSYSPAEIPQINHNRLYDRLFNIFENDRRNHPSISMMDPDPSLFPKGLREILSDERLAVEEEEAPRAVRDMILDSWKCEDRRHILLIGEGGIGKTVAMLTLPEEDWFKELGIPVIYVPLQRLDIYEGDLNRYIKEKIGSNDYERCIESANRTAKEHPNLLLLLDGFNEIPDRFKQTAEKSIREWMERPGNQIITTSRLGFFLERRFLKYRLQPLPYDTVRSFLLSAGISDEQLPRQNDRIWNVINVPLMLALYTQIEKVREITELSSAASVLEWREPDNAAHIIWDYLQMELYRCIEKRDSTYSAVQYAVAMLAIAPYISCQMSCRNKFYIKRAEFIELIKNALSFFIATPDMLIIQILNVREEFDPYHEEDLFLESKAAWYATILIDGMGLFQTQKIQEPGSGKVAITDYYCSLMHQNFRDALAAFFICSCLTKTYGTKEKGELLNQVDLYVKDYMAEHLSDRELVTIWERHRKEEPEDGPITFILMDLIGRQRNYDYRELDFSGLDLTRINLHRLLSRRLDICPLPGDRNRLSNTRISMDCLLPKGHSAGIQSIVFTPDGRELLSSAKDGKILVWGLEDGRLLTLERDAGSVKSFTFSPDERYFAYVTNGSVRIWDIESGENHVLEGYSYCAFSTNGNFLAYDGNMVQLWDLVSRERRVIEVPAGWFSTVAFSPDGRQLACTAYDGTLRIWDLSSGKSRALEGHAAQVNSVAFSPNGRQLASGADDRTVRIWDLSSGESRVLEGHAGSVNSVAFSPNGRQLASGADDRTVRIWNLASGESRVMEGHNSYVNSVAFSPDGRQLASGANDGTVRILNLDTEESRMLAGDYSNEVFSAVFSPDSRFLAGGASDRTVRLWNLESGESRVLEEHSDNSLSISYSPDGNYLANSVGNKVHIWNLKNWEFCELEDHTSKVLGVTYSPDGRYLVSVSDDRTVRILNLASGENLVMEGHNSYVNSVAFSPDGRQLASGAIDGTVRILNLDTEESRVLAGHKNAVYGVAFHPNGRQLASCSRDGTVRLWDLKSGANRILYGHACEDGHFMIPTVSCVAFSPNGKLLAGGGGYFRIWVWNLESGERRELSHRAWITSVAFSPNGRLLATSAREGKVQLWNLEKYQYVGKFVIIPHLNLNGANFELAIIDEKDKDVLRAAGAKI